MFGRIEINPLDLHDEQKRQLMSNFLSLRQWDGRFIHRGSTYWVGWQRITFTRDILIRKKTADIWHYDVIDDKHCGEGKAGSAYKIIAVLRRKLGFLSSELIPYEKQKRVYKIQKNAALKEFELMKRCPHLMARFLIPGIPTLISMRKFDGILLDEALNEERSKKPYTHSQRYRLTISLLRALKKQMHDNLICHCDIKPDNIFLDAKTGEVFIFDLGASHLVTDDSDHRSRGNALYTAPEDFVSAITGNLVTASEFRYLTGMESQCTVKSDIYSMARVIGLIWRDSDPAFFNANANHTQLMTSRILNGWRADFNLFRELNSVSVDEKNKIESQLRLMTSIKPGDRPELNACINYFDELFLDYKLTKVPVVLQRNFVHAHQLAIVTLQKLDEIEKIHNTHNRIKLAVQELKLDAQTSVEAMLQIIQHKYNSNNYNVLAFEVRELCQLSQCKTDQPVTDCLKIIAVETSVAALMDILKSAISELVDEPYAVAEFVETLDIKCLEGCSTVKQLNIRADGIISEFINNIQILMQLYEEMSDKHNTTMIAELDYLFASINAECMNLDGIKKSSAHIQRKLGKIQVEMPLESRPKI